MGPRPGPGAHPVVPDGSVGGMFPPPGSPPTAALRDGERPSGPEPGAGMAPRAGRGRAGAAGAAGLPVGLHPRRPPAGRGAWSEGRSRRSGGAIVVVLLAAVTAGCQTRRLTIPLMPPLLPAGGCCAAAPWRGLVRQDLDGRIQVDDGDLDRFGIGATRRPRLLRQRLQALEDVFELFADLTGCVILHGRAGIIPPGGAPRASPRHLRHLHGHAPRGAPSHPRFRQAPPGEPPAQAGAPWRGGAKKRQPVTAAALMVPARDQCAWA